MTRKNDTAPRTTREMFLLFRRYEPERGLASVMEHIDWSAVTPCQVYWAVLGRLPESRYVARPGPGYDAAQHFKDVVESSEFQERFIEIFLEAFPEKQRLIFVHIPKCAGTDLESDLSVRFPTLADTLTISRDTRRAALLDKMATLVKELDNANAIFVHGHIPLPWYLDHRVYRFGDRIFTIVREPISLVLSSVNYILTVLLSDPDVERVDSAEWLATLGLTRVPSDITSAEKISLAKMILHNQRLTKANYLCTYLGTGTAESTQDPIAISDIDVIDMSEYENWRKKIWNIPESLHINKSLPILTKHALSSEDNSLLLSLTEEDREFYQSLRA